MTGPLSGVRILDMTHVILGPYATQQLADLGADVIKIESLEGDSLRQIGPARHPGMGPLFLHMNRNKRSLSLDLKQPAAHAALLRLIAGADVFTCNMRAQALERLGLDWPSLQAVNPRLIYVSMSGFSQKGPYAEKSAYDDVIQAAVAVPAMIAKSGDGTPRYAPTPIADRAVGLYAMGVICAALYGRQATGEGERIEIPMFETMTQFVLGDHLYGRTFSPPTGDFGYPRLLTPGRRPYATRDGFLACLVYTDPHWRYFAKVFNLPQEIADAPRFETMKLRTDHIDEFYDIISDTLIKYTTAEVLGRIGEMIPNMISHTLESLLEDPHLKEIGFIEDEIHPSEGLVKRLGVPSEWENADLAKRYPTPRLGEHSREILAEAGFSAQEIASMIESGMVRQAPPLNEGAADTASLANDKTLDVSGSTSSIKETHG